VGKIVHAFTIDAGRRFVGDEKLLTSVTNAPTGQPARKTRLATFYGSAVVSERGEDGNLHVFHIGTSALPTDAIGDKSSCNCDGQPGGMSASKYQANIEAWRKKQIVERPRKRAGAR
jgi:hypothetical protein